MSARLHPHVARALSRARAALFLCAAVALASSCDAAAHRDSNLVLPTGPDPAVGLPTSDPQKPVLFNVGLALAPFDAGTGIAGDLSFGVAVQRAFGEFGRRSVAEMPGQVPSAARPHLAYASLGGTPVLAAADGVVRWRRDEDGDGLMQLLVAPDERSPWWMRYEQVVRPRVDSGSIVRAGEVLAYVRGSPEETSSWTFAVGNADEGRAYCPLSLLAPSVRDATTRTLQGIMRDWEAMHNDVAIYDEAAMTVPGCLAETVEWRQDPDGVTVSSLRRRLPQDVAESVPLQGMQMRR